MCSSDLRGFGFFDFRPPRRLEPSHGRQPGPYEWWSVPWGRWGVGAARAVAAGAPLTTSEAHHSAQPTFARPLHPAPIRPHLDRGVRLMSIDHELQQEQDYVARLYETLRAQRVDAEAVLRDILGRAEIGRAHV